MQVRELGGEPTVDLFWERRGGVIGTQPRFQVRDGDPEVKGGKRAREGRGRVALDDHDIRSYLRDGGFQAAQRPGGDPGECLALPQDVEIDVGNDAEQGVDLVEHAPVLSGDGDDRAKVRRGSKLTDHRCHLDCFRAGAIDHQDGTVWPTAGTGR